MQLNKHEQEVFNNGYAACATKNNILIADLLKSTSNQQYAFDQVVDYLYGKPQHSPNIKIPNKRLPCDNIVNVLELLLKDTKNVLESQLQK